MISIETETLLPLRDVPSKLPRRPSGKKVHKSAVYRWMGAGIRGVVLETIKLGGCTYTSLEALQRFASALSQARAVAHPVLMQTGQAEAAARKLGRLLGLSDRVAATDRQSGGGAAPPQ